VEFKQLSFLVRNPISLGLVLALALRVIYVFLIPNAIQETWRDGLSYDNIARNLISGVGYWDTTGEWPGEPPYADPSAPTARWMPGYPVFVAGIYLIFGENPRAVYLMQALLGVMIAGFTYLVAKHTLDEQVAVLALMLYALDPLSLSLSGSFQTEQLFTALVIISVYFFLKTGGDVEHRIAFSLLFGLFSGLAALTRNVAGLMFVGLCVGALFGWDNRFARIRLPQRAFIIIIASVTFFGTLGPWLVRNYHLTGHYTLSTQTWQTLTITNNDKGGAYMTREGLAAMPYTTIEQPEAEREAIYKSFLIEWIAANPGRFLALCLWRAIAFWSPLATFVSGGAALVTFVFNTILLVFAGAYGLAYRKSYSRLFPYYMSFLTFTLGYSIAMVTTRYRLPLYPLLEILAAGGILMFFERHSPYANRVLSGIGLSNRVQTK
jgi:4-amino-4-deoxy-L-arabinose transferase-like glycosyltransferase